jgi:hypothetical protein
VGERPRPFGPPLAWDPVTATLIFGEHDAVLVDTLTTVAEAEALSSWVALHHRNLTTIYITPAGERVLVLRQLEPEPEVLLDRDARERFAFRRDGTTSNSPLFTLRRSSHWLKLRFSSAMKSKGKRLGEDRRSWRRVWKNFDGERPRPRVVMIPGTDRIAEVSSDVVAVRFAARTPARAFAYRFPTDRPPLY